VGKVIIDDKKNVFSPVSAREGLVDNDAFKQLTNITSKNDTGYFFKIFRKLEKFVVDGLAWFILPDEKSEDEIESIGQENIIFEDKDAQILGVLTSVVNTLTNKNDILDLELNQKYVLSLAQKEKQAFEKMKEELLGLLPEDINVRVFLKDISSSNLKNVILTQTKHVKDLRDENKNLKSKITAKNRELDRKKKELKASDEENMFLRASTSRDTKSLEHLMHKIADNVKTINGDIYNIRNRIKLDNYSKNDIEEFINKIQKHLQYVAKIAEFAINRNYRIAAGKRKIDMIKYIIDYLKNMETNKLYGNIILNIDISKKISNNINIKPLELSIMIDNIISNSKKANASKVSVIIKKKGQNIYIDFLDNGKGISVDTLLHRIFEKGYTTTDGSGLGLYYLKEFVETQLKGKVNADSTSSGFNLRMVIPCN
jgi:signal transduction histidine kinase